MEGYYSQAGLTMATTNITVLKLCFFFFIFAHFLRYVLNAVLKAKGVFVDKIIKILFLGKTDLA